MKIFNRHWYSNLPYSKSHDDSIVAKNLRACNLFRLYNGNAALDEDQQIQTKLCIFKVVRR